MAHFSHGDASNQGDQEGLLRTAVARAVSRDLQQPSRFPWSSWSLPGTSAEVRVAPEFTKPSSKKHRINPGGAVNLCAGISKGRIVLWEYLDGPWSGESASKLYAGPIMKALKKHHGVKPSYKLLEDNDPRGHKSAKARKMKAALNIKPMAFPRYSPDLMPLDYSIWEAVQTQMKKAKKTGNESVKQFKKRLRTTALRLPRTVVCKALANLKKRDVEVCNVTGGRIKFD